MSSKSDDPDAKLHDAVMSAAGRDRTAHETGRRRDNLQFILALWKVAWRVRRTEKTATRKGQDRG